MRILLALLMLSDFVLAGLPEGAGPRPPVTTKYVPEFINEVMRDIMRDPPAMYYYGWTQPELRTTKVGNKEIGWWSMEITISGNNGYRQYMGVRQTTFRLTIENMRVTRILVVDTKY